MIKNFAVLALLGSATLWGQSTPKPEAFSKTELLALQAVKTEYQSLSQLQTQASNDLKDFTDEVAKNHPGYHFNAQTLSVEKDVVKEQVPSKAPAEVVK